MNSFNVESLGVYNCTVCIKFDNFTVNSTCLKYNLFPSLMVKSRLQICLEFPLSMYPLWCDFTIWIFLIWGHEVACTVAFSLHSETCIMFWLFEYLSVWIRDAAFTVAWPFLQLWNWHNITRPTHKEHLPLTETDCIMYFIPITQCSKHGYQLKYTYML